MPSAIVDFFGPGLLDERLGQQKLAARAIEHDAGGAFVVFCLLAGAVYTVNDIVDAPRDQGRKPGKPIPAGLVSPRLAWAVVVGSVLLAGGWMLESTHYLGGAVIFLGVPLATVWAVYALYRILTLLGAAWQAVRKN